MSWSLFRIHHTDNEDVATQLKRLADMFETYLRLQFDYHVTPPKPVTQPDDEPASVEYATDEQTARAELKEEVARYQAIVDEEVDELHN